MKSILVKAEAFHKLGADRLVRLNSLKISKNTCKKAGKGMDIHFPYGHYFHPLPRKIMIVSDVHE